MLKLLITIEKADRNYTSSGGPNYDVFVGYYWIGVK